MRRREFIGLLGATALSISRPGHAQKRTDLPLVGFLLPAKSESEIAKARAAALRKGLQEERLVEGKNYSLAMRFAEGDLDRLPQLAMELGALNPRVIVMGGYFPYKTVHTRLPQIPIVFTGIAADPIALGWAQSYAHPGGMITGNVLNAAGGEETMVQKRIGLFKQLVPDLTRLGVIASEEAIIYLKEGDALRKVATELGFELLHYRLKTVDDLESAFAAGLRDDVSAFYISGEPMLFINLSRVMSLVTASRKPSVGPYPDWGRAGLLMSYSTDPLDGFRRAGAYAAKILNGARAGDLPIEQASKFTLVINQKSATALGIVVPPTLLALADEVIE
jgi:putative tryptophan/tyrosine transport system substrate-binding protein